MSKRQSKAHPETFHIASDTQWEEVGLENGEGMEAEEEEIINVAQDQEEPPGQGGQAEDGSEAGDALFLVSAGNTRSSASGEHGHGAGTADDCSTGLVEQARTKSPTPRGMDRRHSRRARGASKARSKGSHQREALVKKKMGSQKAQRQAALTGDLAPFPTLSR